MQTAAAYALLFIAVLVIIGALAAWSLQRTLISDVRSRVDGTMSAIEHTASSTNPFSFDVYGQTPLQMLLSTENIAGWQTPTTFIQIDNIHGYALAKSSNLGDASLPANVTLTSRHPLEHRMVSVAGRPFLVAERLFSVGGGTNVVILVGEPLDQLYRAFTRIGLTILIVLLGATLAILGLSYWLASRMVVPIEQLAAAMREIGSERLHRRLAWKSRHDELGDLAKSFDDLLARLEEAFVRERQFIADASHELKTPLTSINANAQMLLRWGDRDPAILHESLQTISHESAALARMVSGMLTLAKADRGDAISMEPLSLAEIAREAVGSTQGRADEKGLTLRFEPGSESPIVLGEPHLMRQILGNLIDNAIKFTPSGEVCVRVGREAEQALVEIEDSGPGIPQDALPHIFERFFRADKAHSREVPGMGLGLAIVRAVVRVHGGSVEAGNLPGGGARFRVLLPRVAPNLTEPS